jgi:TonB family protein
MRTLLVACVLLAGCTKKSGNREEASRDMVGVSPGGGDKGGARGSDDNFTPKNDDLKRNIEVILDGELEISAGMGKDVVRKVIKDSVTKLQYCYEKTLLANPGIEGKVMATFTIAPEGSVTDVKCAGVHPDVETCVAETVKALKFPPSAAKVEVQYPFTFKPA